jgi:hypothetical protein
MIICTKIDQYDTDEFEEKTLVMLPFTKDTNSNIIKRLGANKDVQLRAFLNECQ